MGREPPVVDLIRRPATQGRMGTVVVVPALQNRHLPVHASSARRNDDPSQRFLERPYRALDYCYAPVLANGAKARPNPTTPAPALVAARWPVLASFVANHITWYRSRGGNCPSQTGTHGHRR